MTSSRARAVFGTLSLISLISSICLSSSLSFKAISLEPGPREISFYLSLMPVLIFSLNISILFAWASIGIAGGSAAGFLSIIAVILLSLRMGRGEYILFASSFLVATFLGTSGVRFKNKLRQVYTLKSEKLDEGMNLLANDIRVKQANVASLEEKLARYSMLKEVVENLSTTLSLDEINGLIIENTSRTLGKHGRVLLFLVDMKNHELMLSASRGDLVVKEKRGDIFDHWILKHRKSLMIESIEKDFRFPADGIAKSEVAFKSLIAAPLVSQDKAIGLLRMDSPHELVYTQDDLRLLDIISDLAAVAVQNSLLYSRTQELAIRDDLTGLVVRRYFMERFHEEIKRAARRKEALSLLILDIDHFKDYNDRYGHAAGDIVLKHLALILKSVVRQGDIAGRYGGEELVVLFLGLDKSEAVKDAERMRKAVKEKPLAFRRNQAILTVSAGLSSYPKDAVSEEELIRMADERLYKAKAAGRDRICSG